jgi:hypothetical protein
MATAHAPRSITRTTRPRANNKTETHTSHQLPAPEIVVASTQLVIAGSAVENVPTRYAYGHADTRYNPVVNRKVFVGYRRKVVLVGDHTPRSGATQVSGYAVVTDRNPPALASSSHDEIVLGGRVRDITRFEGLLPVDPRDLLDATAHLGLRRAKTSHTYGVVELLPDYQAPAVGVLECMDVDVEHGAPGFEQICASSGSQWRLTDS